VHVNRNFLDCNEEEGKWRFIRGIVHFWEISLQSDCSFLGNVAGVRQYAVGGGWWPNNGRQPRTAYCLPHTDLENEKSPRPDASGGGLRSDTADLGQALLG
jgi:hypothetical protein